ncbi:hypothetical protein [Neisseria sp. Ec49-e6-T10]|uniref:hypothetical protein n=1 Tax=Neisseria sp. Ec49-e6-T10 TaxID=3140744 RepID=UPI003EBF7BF6
MKTQNSKKHKDGKKKNTVTIIFSGDNSVYSKKDLKKRKKIFCAVVNKLAYLDTSILKRINENLTVGFETPKK